MATSFGGAGDYKGLDSDSDDDSPAAKPTPAPLPGAGATTAGEKRKYFDDDPEDAFLETTAPSSVSNLAAAQAEAAAKAEDGKEEGEERPVRLEPLSGSSLPSVRDLLDMDKAAEKEEQRLAVRAPTSHSVQLLIPFHFDRAEKAQEQGRGGRPCRRGETPEGPHGRGQVEPRLPGHDQVPREQGEACQGARGRRRRVTSRWGGLFTPRARAGGFAHPRLDESLPCICCVDLHELRVLSAWLGHDPAEGGVCGVRPACEKGLYFRPTLFPSVPGESLYSYPTLLDSPMSSPSQVSKPQLPIGLLPVAPADLFTIVRPPILAAIFHLKIL